MRINYFAISESIYNFMYTTAMYCPTHYMNAILSFDLSQIFSIAIKNKIVDVSLITLEHLLL